MKDRKYYFWLFWLKKCGQRYFGWTPETTPCPKSWRILYDDGMNVMEALVEDLKNQ